MVRRTYPPRSTKCARCSGTRAKGQAYCRPCTNAYRRAYRQGEKLLAPPTLQPRPMTDAEIDECARRGLAELRSAG